MKNNGNRYVISVDGKGASLDRNMDKLYRQYANLLYSIFQKHAWKLDSGAKRSDLKGYIDYQFVVLTKEFNVSGNVDYPYYIKTKLNMRTHSYVDRLLGKEKDEFLGSKDDTVEVLAEDDYEDLDFNELFDYVIGNSTFTNLQKDILTEFIESSAQVKDNKIITNLAKKHKVTREHIKTEIEELKDYIRYKCDKYRDLTVYKNHKTEGKVNTQNTTWE